MGIESIKKISLAVPKQHTHGLLLHSFLVSMLYPYGVAIQEQNKVENFSLIALEKNLVALQKAAHVHEQVKVNAQAAGLREEKFRLLLGEELGKGLLREEPAPEVLPTAPDFSERTRTHQ